MKPRQYSRIKWFNVLYIKLHFHFVFVNISRDFFTCINEVLWSESFAYGHTNLNTPDLVWSWKLNYFLCREALILNTWQIHLCNKQTPELQEQIVRAQLSDWLIACNVQNTPLIDYETKHNPLNHTSKLCNKDGRHDGSSKVKPNHLDHHFMDFKPRVLYAKMVSVISDSTDEYSCSCFWSIWSESVNWWINLIDSWDQIEMWDWDLDAAAPPNDHNRIYTLQTKIIKIEANHLRPGHQESWRTKSV